MFFTGSFSGSQGGGQRVTITGKGFHKLMTVKICTSVCSNGVMSGHTQYECNTPPGAAPGPCSVSVESGMFTATKAGGYTYNPTSPTIAKIEPTQVSMAGGRKLTITGSGFG